MICDDSLCQQLNTCKWDVPVGSAYCGNMYSPSVDQPAPAHVPSFEDRIDREDLMRVVQDLRDEVAYLRRTPLPTSREAQTYKKETNKPSEQGGYRWDQQ